MTHPLPDRDSIFFLRCYRAHNYSHAWLQMSVYLCQFSPVKIYVSTPHRCLSLHRAQAATHEPFYPCLHLKETQVAQQDRMLGWLQQLSAILLILFYFINTDSFLSVCVRAEGWTSVVTTQSCWALAKYFPRSKAVAVFSLVRLLLCVWARNGMQFSLQSDGT